MGLCRLTASMFKKTFNQWPLVYLSNRYLGGHRMTSFEMDYLPGKNSAGFFAIQAEKSLDQMQANELIVAGMQIQRIWLGLTKQGLLMQPAFVSIALAYHHRKNQFNSEDKWIMHKLNQTATCFKENGFDDKTIIIARYGFPACSKRTPRSIRKKLTDLMLD
jgi:hypothetical protein